MPNFSNKSRERLGTCDPRLVALMNAVIRHFDFTVVCGVRTVAEQASLVEQGRSRTLNSRHLPDTKTGLSNAVDIAPWPYNEKDHARFYYLAGFVKMAAICLDIPVRFGGDWDDDTDVADQRFIDLFHFELKP